MGFKLASLFVTVEAQTRKFAAQMSGIRKSASDAGRDVAGTDFTPSGEQLAAVFAGLPGKLSRAMEPVGGRLAASLQKGVAPLAKVETTVRRLGATIAHAFRFDIVEQGIGAAQAAVNFFFAGATGGAAALGASLKAALAFGSLTNGLARLRARIASLISPSQNLARAILGATRVGLAGSRAAVDRLFAGATGRSKALGLALKKALDLGIALTRSKLLMQSLARMVSPVRIVRGLVGGLASGLARAASAAGGLAAKLTGAKQAGSGLKGIIAEMAIAAGFAAVGFKVVDFFRGAVSGASDLRETIDKVDAVLGDAAPAVKAFADDMAAKFGLVRRVTLDAASGFAGLAKGLGQLKGQALSDFSTKFTKLAADFSSFANIDFDEAQKSIKIGLTGEPSDVLKQFGVIVNETLTKQYALTHGMKAVNGELTQQQKLMARAGLITDQLNDANDNLADTQDSTANRIRKAQGQWENLATTIGQSLLPFVNKAIAMFSELTQFLGRSFEKNRTAIEGFTNRLVVGLDVVRGFVANAATAWEFFQVATRDLWADATLVFGTGVENAGRLLGWLGKAASDAFAEMGRVIRGQLTNIGKNVKDWASETAQTLINPFHKFNFRWEPMVDGFKLALDRLPPLMAVQFQGLSKEAKDLLGKILRDVDWDPKVKLGAGIKKGQAVDLPDAPEKEKKQGQVTDIASFARSLQESVGGKNDAAKETAKATREAVDQLKQLNRKQEAVGKMNGGAAGPDWQAAGLC